MYSMVSPKTNRYSLGFYEVYSCKMLSNYSRQWDYR